MTQALTLSQPLQGLRLRAERLLRAYPREAVGVGVLAFALAVAIGGAAYSTHDASSVPAAAPPAPPPLLLKQVAPAQALQINQSIPVASGPNPAAQPFLFKGNPAARSQALQCLASAVYYEAGNQDVDGERAVAQVVLNRVRHPAFPASVCGVVYEGSTRTTGCQFTFTCDGSLYRQPDADGWKRAYAVAQAALSGAVYAPVGYATHYHANYVLPYWASTLAKNAIVGAHIFYRWAGGWGQPAAFIKTYTGHEPSAAALRAAALSVVHTTPTLAQGGALADLIAKVPGAEPLKLAPSMRGDKRVAVRFNLVGRKAADDAAHEDYVKKFEASDNLKWAMSSEVTASSEKPLGKGTATPAPGSSSVSGQR
jgi:spore germination cell wall hydrolase CwlJ-like protein